MIAYKRLRAAFGIGFCAIVLPLCALAGGGEVGYIEKIPASKGSVLITRMGQPIESKLFTPIRVGDQITVTGDDAQLTVRLAGGDRINVSASNSPFGVAEHFEELSISKNVREWLAELFGRLHKDENTYTVPMTVRGDDYKERAEPPNLLFLTMRKPTLVSEDHGTLRLEWVYGVTPFQIKVMRASDGNEIVSIPGIATRTKLKCTNFLKNPPESTVEYVFGVDLKITGLGRHRILVGDALGNVGSRMIDIVQNEELGEKWLAKLDQENLPEHLVPVVRVSSLIKNEENKLLYNARQVLGPLDGWDYPTRLLGNRLLCNAITSGPH